MTGLADRLPHQRWRDQRTSQGGLVASINRQDHPVLNSTVGGLPIGECRLSVIPGQRLFVTLFEQSRPQERAFLYGIVVSLDRWTHEVALDFEKPSAEAFGFLERWQSRSVGPVWRPAPPPRGMLGWLKRIAGRNKQRR